MVIGLVTLALLWMLQALGALVQSELIDQAWRSAAVGDDDRDGASAWRPSRPAAAGPVAPSAPRRVDRALAVVDDTPPLFADLPLGPHRPRGPPAPPAHPSR